MQLRERYCCRLQLPASQVKAYVDLPEGSATVGGAAVEKTPQMRVSDHFMNTGVTR